MRKLFLSLFKLLGGVLLAGILLLVGCQSSLIYFPRPYDGRVLANLRPPRYESLTWQTGQGQQTGFLGRPRQGHLPQRLWIVCAGNGSLALDLKVWLEAGGPKGDAFFYVDYPGYGNCQGKPNPDHIRDSLRAGVPVALDRLGWTLATHRSQLRVFGHSLGAANALQAAVEFQIAQGVLLSPFTSMMDMAKATLGLPLGPLVVHRFDNLASLDNLCQAVPGCHFHIIHGQQDEVIPYSQAQELHRKFPQNTTLHPVPGGRHNNLLELASGEVSRTLQE